MLPEIFHLTYTSLFLFYHSFRIATWMDGDEHKPNPTKTKKNILVVIPVYNEKYEVLKEVLEKLIEAKKYYEENGHGEVKIVLIDDGSTNGGTIFLPIEFPEVVFVYQKNKGKREAQATGVRRFIDWADILINIDSDSVLSTKDAFVITKSIFDREKQVGAITGYVRVRNTDKLLPKILSVRYDLAFLGERYAESSYGYLDCVSGPFSAYRMEIIRKVLDKYLNQTFLGKKQTYGDDRHLTNLVLQNGWKVKFVPWIVIYTDAPEDIRSFFRQQKRWRKSFIRETIYLWKNVIHSIPSTKFKLTQFLKLSTTVLSVIMRAGIIGMAIIVNPIYFVHYLIMVFLMSFSKIGYILAIYKPNKWSEKILLNTVYAYIHEFVVVPTLLIASMELTDVKWGTR